MNLQIIFYSYIVAVFATGIFKFKQRDSFEIIPSVIWLFAMGLPFWLLHDPNLNPQWEAELFGFLSIGFGLLLAEAFTRRRFSIMPQLAQPITITIAQSLVILVGGLQVIHMGLLQYNIQLVNWIVEGRFYSQPTETYIWLQTALVVASPLTLGLLLRCRRWGLLAFSFLFSAFYFMNLSLKWGLVFLCLGILLITAESARIVPRRALILIFSLVAIPICIGYVELYKDGNLPFQVRLSSLEIEQLSNEFPEGAARTVNAELDVLSQAEHFLLFKLSGKYRDLGFTSQILNSSLFELFLLPAESDVKWYQSFNENSKTSLLDETWRDGFFQVRREDSLAHHIGTRLFRSRVPASQFERSFIWGSVDADFFWRWGTLGIVFSGVFAFVLRSLIRALRVRSTWGESLNLCALFFLGLGLANGSALAVLGRFAVSFFIFLMLVYFLICRKYLQLDYISGHRSFDIEDN